MILVKLGGSVITDKSKELTPRTDVIARLTQEIADSGQHCLVIHGAGSFGHIKAKQYCLKDGTTHPEYKQGIDEVQMDMRRLNGMVVDAFHAAGMSVATIPAGAISVFEDGELVELPANIFKHYLDIGITPISFGDVVVDRKRGVCICSGDDIMTYLAKELDIKKCFFVTSEDGIFSHYPPDAGEGPISEIEHGHDISFTSMNTDVTGGMKRKLELIFNITSTGCDVTVLNGLVPGRLREALEGKKVIGTFVRGGV